MEATASAIDSYSFEEQENRELDGVLNAEGDTVHACVFNVRNMRWDYALSPWSVSSHLARATKQEQPGNWHIFSGTREPLSPGPSHSSPSMFSGFSKCGRAWYVPTRRINLPCKVVGEWGTEEPTVFHVTGNSLNALEPMEISIKKGGRLAALSVLRSLW